MDAQPASAYVASRRIGSAIVTIISEGSMRWAPELQAPEVEWRRAMPEAGANGEITLGLNVVHIRLGGASILVDPGFDDPARPSPWDEAGLVRSPGLLAGLATIGVRPEQITHVLITHAHGDHFAGVTTEREGQRVARYPRARHLLGRREWEGNPGRELPDSDLMIHLGTIQRLGLLDLVDGDHEVVPGVTMMHAPGESPGHSIVCVRSGGESFYVLGDLFHHACEVEHPGWVSTGRDQAAMRVSRDRLMAEAVQARATLVFTHERFPPWGRIVSTGTGYRWQRA